VTRPPIRNLAIFHLIITLTQSSNRKVSELPQNLLVPFFAHVPPFHRILWKIGRVDFVHEFSGPCILAFFISLATDLGLYNAYVSCVQTHGTREKRWDNTFDQWCLRRIIHVPYTAHHTNQPLVSSIIKQRRLKLFGHIARAAPLEDHTSTASIYWPPTSLQTGAVQEIDHARPGFTQSSVISNRSYLVSTQYCDGQRIVPPAMLSARRHLTVMISFCVILLTNKKEINKRRYITFLADVIIRIILVDRKVGHRKVVARWNWSVSLIPPHYSRKPPPFL